MNEKLWWYIARSGGLVAWWMVSASVLWGLLLSTKVLQKKAAPAWLLDLHKFLGALSVVFTALHVFGLVMDSWLHFGPAEILVPMTSAWRPGAVSWGVIAMYLVIAIEVTSLMMRRLPRKLWRAVHSSSFVLFALSSVHAFTAGSDNGNVAVQWSALGISAAFTFLAVFRQLTKRRGNAAGRRQPVAA